VLVFADIRGQDYCNLPPARESGGIMSEIDNHGTIDATIICPTMNFDPDT